MVMTSLVVLALAFGPSLQDPKPSSPRVIRVSAERFAYSPSEIVVDKGTVIEFHLTSDDTDHGFHIPGASVQVAIPPSGRGEARVRFIAQKKGRFVFECSRPCGAGHNLMRGYIEVK